MIDNCIISKHRINIDPNIGFESCNAVRYYHNFKKRYGTIDLSANFDRTLFDIIKEGLFSRDYLEPVSLVLDSRGLYQPDFYILNMCNYFLEEFGLVKTIKNRKKIKEHMLKFLVDQSGFKPGELTPLTMAESIRLIKSDLGSKSAGYPYGTSKGKAIDLMPEILNKRIGFFRNKSYPVGDGCCILSFARSYVKSKSRAV
jgi:hypothetical protein